MQAVWCFFKAVEVFCGVCCVTFHISGFLNRNEPLPHNMFFCGTFFGFFLNAFFGCISICMGSSPTVLMEAIVNSFGAVLHLIASVLAMYQAERDFHLMYLSDFEEPLHDYFFYCKAESTSALACGAFYLLHSIFAFDALIIRDQGSVSISMDEDDDLDQDDPKRPIKLYFLGKFVHTKLMAFKFFRRISGKR